MNFDESFYSIWRKFQGRAEVDELPLCPIAKSFEDKMQAMLFEPMAAGASLKQVAQAMFWLQREWQNWRNSVPQWHQRRCSARNQCLDEVYHACYDRLRLMELSIKPPDTLLLDYEERTEAKESLPQPVFEVRDTIAFIKK